ncbi:MAG: hypothetical protein ACAH83_01100 [Alphaproteobacteria bacterium]
MTDPIEQVSLDKIVITNKVPDRVDAAVKLLCLAIIVSIIGLVMNIALGYAPVGFEGMALMFVGYALIALLVLKISLGRNWARVIFTMILGFQLGGSPLIIGVIFKASYVLGFLYLGCLGLQVAAVAMLYMKGADGFFEKK